MLNGCFRSDSEDKFADSTGHCASKYADQDKTIFYSVQYEQELLMKYIGESTAIGESVNESDAEFSNFDPFIFGELPSYAYIDPTRSPVCSLDSSSFTDCELKILNEASNIHGSVFHQQPSTDCERKISNEDKNINGPVSHQQPSSGKNASRRGRPKKVTSTSKMASYARNYREQKKNQLLACETQIKDLTEENKFLRSENKRLTEEFARLTEKVNNLQKIIERNLYTHQDSLQIPHFKQRSYEKHLINDVSDVCSLIMLPQ